MSVSNSIKSNKLYSHISLLVALFCILLQIVLLMTIQTYFIYIIGMALIFLPIGIAGSLFLQLY